jgi:hypothetical protein
LDFKQLEGLAIGIEGFSPLTKGKKRAQDAPGRAKPRAGKPKQDVEAWRPIPIAARKDPA